MWSKKRFLRKSGVIIAFVILNVLVINSKPAAGSISGGRTSSRTMQVMEEPPLRVITGIVKDEKGRPVEGAFITATIPYIDQETATDSEGKFRFRTAESLIPTGTTRSPSSFPLQEVKRMFVRQKERNLAAEIELDDKKDNYEITLRPGVIFSGMVFDVNGVGIPKAKLSLGIWMSDRGNICAFEEPTKIDSEGNFEIRAVLQGHRYFVSASADGYGEGYVETNTSEVTNERINLEPLVLNIANLSVSGVVVDQNDEPVSSARVSASGNGQPSMRQTRTNAKGEFTLEKMCAGQIFLDVRKEGPQSLVGRATVKGGDKEIRVVVSSSNLVRRPVPRQPASLVNKPLPGFDNIEIEFSAEQAKDKRILICFWDLEQRPSRTLVTELAKQAQKLTENNVVVLLIHTSEISQDEIEKWTKEYNIPFSSGRITKDFDKVKFSWGVRGLPWLILTDKNGYVQAEGIDLAKLGEILQETKPDKAEESKEREILNMLYEASEKNKALIKQGGVEAIVNYTYYDEKGQEDRKSENEVRAVFKGEKVRIEQKELNDERQIVWRAAATEESCIENFEGDNDAYLRIPESIERIHFYCHFLPSRNTAFVSAFLKYDKEKLISRNIYSEDSADGKVYVIEMVLKSRPKDLLRYVMAPDKAGSVLKFESYHDFGQGNILLRQDIAEMQSIGNGGWYLKRFSSTSYREDGALRRKEEIEIKNFNFTFEVLDQEFTWEAIGVTKGMRIHDSRLGISYIYGGPSDPSKESEFIKTSQDEIPKQVKIILDAINDGKDTRETFRNLYALMNKPAPNLETATWINSKPLRLADLQGKIIVLDFWGIDCGPCLGDIEELNKIHERGKTEPVVVIGIHHPGVDISEIKKVMAKYNVKYPVCIDSAGGSEKFWHGRTFEKYTVNAIPRPFLIDIKGNIRSVASPVNLWEVDELIEEHENGITGTSPSEPEFLLGLKVAPEKVNLVDLSKGQKIQKSVYIYKPDVTDFTVKIELEPEKPAIGKLVKYEQESAMLYELIINFTADFQGKNYSSEIKLITNDKGKPEIVIPITANIISEEN